MSPSARTKQGAVRQHGHLTALLTITCQLHTHCSTAEWSFNSVSAVTGWCLDGWEACFCSLSVWQSLRLFVIIWNIQRKSWFCCFILTHQFVEFSLWHGAEGIVGGSKEGQRPLLVQQLCHTCCLDGSNQETETESRCVCFLHVCWIEGWDIFTSSSYSDTVNVRVQCSPPVCLYLLNAPCVHQPACVFGGCVQWVSADWSMCAPSHPMEVICMFCASHEIQPNEPLLPVHMSDLVTLHIVTHCQWRVGTECFMYQLSRPPQVEPQQGSCDHL